MIINYLCQTWATAWLFIAHISQKAPHFKWDMQTLVRSFIRWLAELAELTDWMTGSLIAPYRWQWNHITVSLITFNLTWFCAYNTESKSITVFVQDISKSTQLFSIKLIWFSVGIYVFALLTHTNTHQSDIKRTMPKNIATTFIQLELNAWL